MVLQFLQKVKWGIKGNFTISGVICFKSNKKKLTNL
jgi:hypothetical protein